MELARDEFLKYFKPQVLWALLERLVFGGPCAEYAKGRSARRERRACPGLESLENRVLLASFQGLGTLPSGGTSSALALSADGSTVVGGDSILAGVASYAHAFRWTQADGMQSLAPLTVQSAARAISADGSAIVGDYNPGGLIIPNTAFQWTSSTGLVPVPGIPLWSQAAGVSANGATIVGQVAPPIGTPRAYEWTQITGFQYLGNLPGASQILPSGATGVSADGSVIVGDVTPQPSIGYTQPVYWDSFSTMHLFTGTQSPQFDAAFAVSADGTTAVGQLDGTPYAWTIGGSAVQLSSFPGNAEAVSAHGSVIVGNYNPNGIPSVFMWTRQLGFQDLPQWLTQQYGPNFLQGWELLSVVGISSDGSVIAGNGTSPQGTSEAWILHLSPAAKGATTTTLTSSPNPSVVGRPVVLTATVSSNTSASPVPTGTVTFTNGAVTLGTATLDPSGKGTISTSTLPVGADSITAVYSGDNNFASSSSPPISQTVEPPSLPPHIALDSVSTTNSSTLTVDYHVDNAGLSASLTIGFYRSATAQFDPLRSVELGSVVDFDPGAGTHEDHLSLANGLVPRTDLPFVLAVADPDNDLAGTGAVIDKGTVSFRTYVIGAVVVGFDPTSTFTSTPASWVQAMATDLVQVDGYQPNAVIPFTWSSASPNRQAVVDASNELFQQLEEAAISLHLQPNDVVDVHLIGHSRGAVVVSTVVQSLISNAGNIPQMDHGYYKVTLLDPHPANLQFGLNASFSPSSTAFAPIGFAEVAGYTTFENTAADPPITIPPRVNEADILYEQTPYDEIPLTSLFESTQFNLLGLAPANIMIQDPVRTRVLSLDLTSPGMGHSEVHEWYLDYAVHSPSNPSQPGPLASGSDLVFVPPSPPTPHSNAATVLSGASVDSLTASGLQSVLASNSTPTISAINDAELHTVLAAVNGMVDPVTPAAILVNLSQGPFNDVVAEPPEGVLLILSGPGGTTVFGRSPAVTVLGGSVLLDGLTLTTDTDAATVVVAGGNLILRNDTVQESTGGTNAAVSLTGGMLDLGTSAEPGGNVLNVNGTGDFVHNATANVVSAIADTFEVNGTPVPPPAVILTGTANQLYVSAVYESVLHRPVDASGLGYWTEQLANGSPLASLSEAIDHSPEYYGIVITNAYKQFLGRSPDAGGLAYWEQLKQSGLADEQLEASFVGSPEYYQHAGGTNSQWVDFMYNALLGRNADVAGKSYWIQQLALGATRDSVAYGFAASTEREGQKIQEDYGAFLDRAPASGEVASWVSAFVQGISNEDIVTGFVSSAEFFERSTSP